MVGAVVIGIERETIFALTGVTAPCVDTIVNVVVGVKARIVVTECAFVNINTCKAITGSFVDMFKSLYAVACVAALVVCTGCRVVHAGIADVFITFVDVNTVRGTSVHVLVVIPVDATTFITTFNVFTGDHGSVTASIVTAFINVGTGATFNGESG